MPSSARRWHPIQAVNAYGNKINQRFHNGEGWTVRGAKSPGPRPQGPVGGRHDPYGIRLV